MTNSDTLAERIAANLRRLRVDHSQDDVAVASRAFGTTWRSGHISHFEKADFKPTHETVALLQLTLTRLLERSVALGELLGYDPEYRPDPDTGEVDTAYWGSNVPFDLGGGFRVAPSDYLAFLRDDDPQRLIAAAESLEALRKRFSPTIQEVRLARKLDTDPLTLDRWSRTLWGTSFEAHRDDLAGEGASPQRKGRFSVQLLDEIRQARQDGRLG